MDYNEEDKEDKKYKKGYSKREFKKDVQDAVEPLMGKKTKKKLKIPKAPIKNKKVAKGSYANMSAAALKKLLNDKKKALLIKSGFPDGKIPRGKDSMINLCVKLKRKRW